MFQTLRNAFKVKDIRSKIFYTFLMLVVVRLGSQLPIPGVDRSYFANWFSQQVGDAFNFFDAFTGGSFEEMSIFALNITPYITSSIIIELLTIAIPKLEEMQKDGEEGRKKLTAITRYVTVGLALLESIAMVIGFGRQGLIPDMTAMNVITVVVSLTAGSAFLMWVGERITEKGVGNGISIVLMINILSRVPSDITTLYETFIKPQTVAKGALAAVIILAVIVVTVVLVILLNGATRNIPVQYAKKMQGRKMVGGQSSSIPLKVNTAGVIPVIFASSLMSMPSIIAAFMGRGNGNGIGSKILKGLSQQNWFSLSNPVYTLGFVLYAVMIVFFAYFYTSITFNPIEVADNMKKQGGFIPGIRPGKPTQDYLEKILNYIIFIGAIGLLIVCTIPIVFNGAFGASVSFGGTSILAVIVVTVVLVILLNGATRNIPVQYAKKMQGRKMVGGQSSSIPLKVNTAGVIPVIFASSLMSMPSIIAAFMGRGNGNGIGSKILKGLSQQNWFSLSNPVYTLGFVLYAVMIVFFAYFYTSITFNPIEVADNMKKQGGFIPGIRPGKPTQDYLEKILNYIIFIGAIGLLIVCTIPIVFNGAFGASVSFGGTSIIIIVGVVLETLKQIESQMLVRNYRGFLSE